MEAESWRTLRECMHARAPSQGDDSESRKEANQQSHHHSAQGWEQHSSVAYRKAE